MTAKKLSDCDQVEEQSIRVRLQWMVLSANYLHFMSMDFINSQKSLHDDNGRGKGSWIRKKYYILSNSLESNRVAQQRNKATSSPATVISIYESYLSEELIVVFSLFESSLCFPGWLRIVSRTRYIVRHAWVSSLYCRFINLHNNWLLVILIVQFWFSFSFSAWSLIDRDEWGDFRTFFAYMLD